MNPTSTNIPMRALESAAKTQSQQCGKTGFHFTMPHRLCAGWLRLSLIVLLSFIASDMFAADAVGDYRTLTGLTSGNWNGTTTWEKCTVAGSPGTWVAVATSPTDADGVISIRSGATVTITASVSYDQVVVDSGGQVTVASTITTTQDISLTWTRPSTPGSSSTKAP